MIAWLRARSLGGKVIMRIEDLDHPKDKPGAAAQAIEDLKWLGFDWDEEYVQSERKAIYRSATEFLAREGFIYPCVCSRKDVEAAQSAPHAGEQLFYPGTCRDRFRSWADAAKVKPLPCWRFRVPEGTRVEFDDVFAGHYAQDVSSTLGDFPIARDEGGAGYTLAATLDDLLMGVTEVVRGDDLLAATPAQILLARTLKRDKRLEIRDKSEEIRYLHVPLVVGKDGRRLAKRHGDTRIASFREAGRTPEELIGMLAASCGWCGAGERISLRGLIPRFTLSCIPRTPFIFAR